MHSYEVEGRGRVVVALALGSILLVWLLHLGLSTIHFQPQWWLSAPSFAGFYSGLHWIFDRWVWRLSLLGKLSLINIPNLDGEWIGTVKSSYDREAAYPVSVIIRQRWSKITVRLDTENSRSHSVAATFRTVDLPFPELSYLYINEPKATAQETMNVHRGTVVLEFRGTVLEGDYYTGRGRMTTGTMSLTRA